MFPFLEKYGISIYEIQYVYAVLFLHNCLKLRLHSQSYAGSTDLDFLFLAQYDF